MKYIHSITKADYLQRSRSYGFLIALATILYAAYSFVPPPSASYITLNAPGFRGVYNSAYVGYISGMMTTIMLSLYGFFMVHGGIKKDIDTGVGLIIATTSISNFEYLLSKMFSNLLVLLTIAGCAFSVSILLFFVRTDGAPFIFAHFITPFLLFVIPAMLLISSLAVIAEVFLGKKIILQYVVFFFLFGLIMTNISTTKNETLAVVLDPFGIHTLTNSIKDLINSQYHTHINSVGLGFIFNKKAAVQTFTWNGISITNLFLLSRMIWGVIAIGLIYLSSHFFHRFNFKPDNSKKKKTAHDAPVLAPIGMRLTGLPPLSNNYSIVPFIKTELLLLLRKGTGWFWLIIAGLSISMLFTPVTIAHGYILPVLWFLQVTRWSELATKEEANGLHYFTFASFKPLQRMLPAQILAGIIFAILLALPLIIRYMILSNGYAIIDIVNGAACVVLLAVCLGIVTKSKKVFEILFFFLTYIITQQIPAFDYLGAMKHEQHVAYIVAILSINMLLTIVSIAVRRYQLRHC